MLPYRTLSEATAALSRNLTAAEAFWLRYSAAIPDPLLFFHNILFLLLIFTLAPLPLALLELRLPAKLLPFKIQPGVRLPRGSFVRCYKEVMRLFVLVVGPLQLASFPIIKFVGIRTSLPLPSGWEIVAQLLVYFLIEDYGNYWIHRLLHCRWGYEKIHKVHHEFTAPMGFAAPYAHWAEILILGIPSFVGPALVPCHMITFWLWIALRQIEAIDTHSGKDVIVASFPDVGKVICNWILSRRYLIAPAWCSRPRQRRKDIWALLFTEMHPSVLWLVFNSSVEVCGTILWMVSLLMLLWLIAVGAALLCFQLMQMFVLKF